MESELKGRIIGVKVQIQPFDLYSVPDYANRLYLHTDKLVKSAQSKRLDDLTMQVLESLRNKERFKNFYLNVLNEAKLHHFVNEPVLSRKRKSPDYSIL